MKPNIHPQYFVSAKVVCACGNTFTTGSTMAEIHTEICSQCHPFYTGKQKLIDTAGTVDRFNRRVRIAAKAQAEKKPKKVRKARVTK